VSSMDAVFSHRAVSAYEGWLRALAHVVACATIDDAVGNGEAQSEPATLPA